MSLFSQHRWFVAAAGFTLAFAAVSLLAQKGTGLTTFADLVGFALMAVASGLALPNAISRSDKERTFWTLTSLAFLLWGINQGAWCVWELLLHRKIPDPFFF